MSVNSQASQSDMPAVGVHIGDVEGGIHDSTIAGRDVVHKTINFLAGGPDVRALRNRRVMLGQIKNGWIKGELLGSRPDMGLVELELTTRLDVVNNPLRAILPCKDSPELPLPPGTRIIDVLDQADGWLLILGEPGAGKTTMLLELASDAIRRAEDDPSEPIPVVLRLSSWVTTQQALDEWVIDELNSKYTVPRIVARQWIDTNQLLLLLDELDEVKAEKRDACVRAINSFRLNYGLPFVVCSRIADYDLIPTRIMANIALTIHPLSASQISEYLTSAGPKLNALQTALSRDSAMMELAHSPLMLNIMSTIYQDLDALDRGRSHSVEERRDQILHIYVQSMFGRRRPDPRYPQDRTIQRLAWLAQQMSRHSESLLIVERLQPSWLQADRHRRQYAILARTLAGGITGGILGVILACLALWELWLSPAAAENPLDLFGAIFLALLVGTIITAVGVVAGLVVGWKYSLRGTIDHIGVVEALEWSWQELHTEIKHRWKTALNGLPMPGALSDQPVWSWRTAISLIGALPAGLRAVVVGDKNGFRRGLAQTAACSVLGAFIGVAYGVTSGMCLALIQAAFDFLYALIQSFPGEPDQFPNLLSLFLTYSIVLAPSLGLLLGVRNGLRLGGFSLVQHLTLRAVLWYTGVVPWDLRRFLEHATRLTFMRKAGNGYFFAHGLLQDYFARMVEETE